MQRLFLRQSSPFACDARHPTVAERRADSDNMQRRFPDKVPVLIAPAPGRSTGVPTLPKEKYIVPADLSVGQLLNVIRKHGRVGPETGLYLFTFHPNYKMLPSSATTVRALHEAARATVGEDFDGFLRLVYCGESTYGGEPPFPRAARAAF